MKTKLTSRKFWAYIITLAFLILAFLFSGDEVVHKLTIVLATALTIAYIIAEAIIDMASAETEDVYYQLPKETAEIEESEETENEV